MILIDWMFIDLSKKTSDFFESKGLDIKKAF